MTSRGFRNSDTRLGWRLTQFGLRSLLAVDKRGIVDHLGPTWHMAHRRCPAAIHEHRAPVDVDPVIANGGANYWTSPEFAASFELVTST